MIGFWNGSVYLTYAGMLAAVTGIFLAQGGRILPAFFCLMFAGACDMFDGKIARAMKRTEDAKRFGIQIDSLSDLVCFGVLPAVICYAVGVPRGIGEAVLALFVLAGLVRLGYFNVTEEQRQQTESGNRKVYRGLPITSSAVALPSVYLLRPLCGDWYGWVLIGFMTLLGLLYVLDIPVPKPGKTGGVLLLCRGVCIAVAFIYMAVTGAI